MKIILIPSPTLKDNTPDIHLPVGLVSLATVLQHSGIEVEILDINSLASDSSYREIPDQIISRNPDIVGFSTMCNQYPNTIRLARRCKQIKPNLQILFGGPQATITDQVTMEAFPFVDIVVRGESEQIITEVMKALAHKEALYDIPGITFRDGEKIIRTKPIQPTKNLEELPLPNYGHFPTIKSLKTIPIEVGRGCPFECSFCSTKSFWMRMFRLRSTENVIRLIKNLLSQYGKKKFCFLHDILTLSKDWVFELCDALKKENLNIEWTCSSRIDCVDKELLKRIATSGCSSIFFGIETGSPRMQKIIGKNLKLDYTIEMTEQVVIQGMSFAASFITGFPEERLDDLQKTINLIMGLSFVGKGSEIIQLHMLAPLKGTKLYDEYGQNLLFDGNFSDVVISEINYDELELIKKYPEIFHAFYYYPTVYLERNLLLRVRYLILNLLTLPYTALIFWKDERLGFSKRVIDHLSMLDLPPHSEDQIGGLENLNRVSEFLMQLLCQLNLKNHFIQDVVKYELSAHTVKSSNMQKSLTLIEEFSYDVEKFIEEINRNGLQRLPKIKKKEVQVLLFTKKDDKVITIKLPQKISHWHLVQSKNSKSEDKKCV